MDKTYNVRIFPYTENGEISETMERVECKASTREDLHQQIKSLGKLVGIGEKVKLTNGAKL